MNIFISGGCKNGKSFFAQQKAREQAELLGRPLYYLATMIPVDEEDQRRISRHVEERAGWGFRTVEQGRNILEALQRTDPGGVFLLDSVTALLSNEMFDEKGNVDLTAPERLKNDLAEFAERTGNTIFVSDFIYGDAMGYEALTERYRAGLALCDRTLAKVCQQVIEVSYGSLNYFKRQDEQ